MINSYNDAILGSIKRNREENRLSHAFIVFGAEEVARKLFARDAVKMLLGGDVNTDRKIDDGNCEDLLIINTESDSGKDSASIKVPQIESMIESLRNKPFTSDIMVAIIEDGDLMTQQSQNKLLKTLEEPSPGYVIFILVSNPEYLTETIRSRCVAIKIRDEEDAVDEESLADAKSILSMLLFQDVALNSVFEELKKYEDKYQKLLYAMKVFLRDIVVGKRNNSLVKNKENMEIVSKLSENNEAKCRKSIYIIEDTAVKLSKGLNVRDSRYSMRDMAVRIRQEANNG